MDNFTCSSSLRRRTLNFIKVFQSTVIHESFWTRVQYAKCEVSINPHIRFFAHLPRGSMYAESAHTCLDVKCEAIV